MASFLRLEAASRPLRGCVHVAVALLEKRFFAFFRNFWWRLSAFLQSILHSFTFFLFSRIFNFAPTSISSRFCLIWNWFGVPRARAFCAISSTLILQEIHIDSRLNFLHFVTRKLLCCFYSWILCKLFQFKKQIRLWFFWRASVPGLGMQAPWDTHVSGSRGQKDGILNEDVSAVL